MMEFGFTVSRINKEYIRVTVKTEKEEGSRKDEFFRTPGNLK